MTTPSRVARGAPLASAAIAATIAIAYLIIVVPGGALLNLVSGVWMGLGRDLAEGLFYRPVLGDGMYGGTRYFPLLIAAIAAGVRAGASVMRAAQAASLFGGVVMVAGVALFVRGAGGSRRDAALAAALAVVPYFVLQTIAEVRVEPLAAGLVWLGAGAVQRSARGPTVRWLGIAAALFILAVAAKPTTAYGGAAAIAALVAARRHADALRLTAALTAGGAIVAAAIHWTSDGRALENFRACAFAGAAPLDLVGRASLDGLRLLLVSHFVSAALAAAVLAAVVTRAWRSLAFTTFVGAVLAAIVALTSHGTIFTSQSVDPYVAAVVVLFATGVVARPRLGPALMAAFFVWAAVGSLREIRSIRARMSNQYEDARAAVAGCPSPLLAESALVPALSGRELVLLDPFAFRVAALRDSQLAEDLRRRILRREFGCIVLDMDPATRRGQGWYANVAFGHGIAEAVTHAYRLRESGSRRFTYVPAAPAESPR